MSSAKTIECEIRIAATIEAVWHAWTTRDGMITFFASSANIDPRPGGAYELFFDSMAPPGQQGSEGMRILSMEPPKFLSFTWNAPPHLSEVRGQMTFVEVHLSSITPEATRVCLRHSGWGSSGQWQKAFEYFSQAWPKIVLPRLKYSLEVGPVDWSNPPEL